MGAGLIFLSVVPLFFASALGDTPANCTYEDIRGSWTFLEGQRSGGSDLECTNFTGPIFHTLKFNLLFPDVAVDEHGNVGHWTVIYNQGFEVIINYRKYFAFSKYEDDGHGNVTSYCDSVLPGWSHDVLGKNWACYVANKDDKVKPKLHQEKKLLRNTKKFQPDPSFVWLINKIQNSWTATMYQELKNLSVEDLIRRSGGPKSRINSPPPPASMPSYRGKLSSYLPEEFDWRNVSGQNFVSPVRDQGECGSCYAFSSLAMLESRLRIATNNTVQVVFSPQDVLSCSEYSQGCEGGFPYLIAGKYAQDFGVVQEQCDPYQGEDDKCPVETCKRYYVAEYNYVGGFYGGCNEALMKLDLVTNGPLTVAFEVYPDFQFYRGGIYHHTGLRDSFNPFMIVNHGVLIVGYGMENKTGEAYWIVKNSWGTEWGEDGYFRIRRGTNECNIESLAVSAIPIP